MLARKTDGLGHAGSVIGHVGDVGSHRVLLVVCANWREWDDSLEVLWRDAGRAFCRLGRRDGASETYASILIPSGAEHPTLDSVNRLIHEHGLQPYLDVPGRFDR